MPRLHSLRAVALASLLGLPIFPGPLHAEQRPPVAVQLGKTYGLESFGQVEAIRYTFNAQRPGVDVSRSWVWEPKTDRVSYEGKDKAGNPLKLTYLRSKLDSQSSDIDAGFVNDQYWLLLAFHVAAWDGGAAVEDAGIQKLPLGTESGTKLVMKYPSDGGYSPGDTWDVYVGSDGRIEAFAYHRGAATKPSLVIADWTDYKKAGPLLLSLDHHGTADGDPTHVSFSNVAVKLVGSSDWIDAK